MTTTTHTPTPWSIAANEPTRIIGDIDNATFSFSDIGDLADLGNGASDAAFIVLACNEHERLVRALHEIIHQFDDHYDGEEMGWGLHDAIQNARAALAKCGGA